MKQFLEITKALSDETRVRALLSLRAGGAEGGEGGELCLCQIIDLLGLAPSTVSKHMDLLYRAGLVERRKEGRWQYYRLAGESAGPVVREALAWALRSLETEPQMVADATRLGLVLKKEKVEVCACYHGN